MQDFLDDMARKGRRNIQAFETSSKSGKNVEELFESVAKDYLDDPANVNLRTEDTLSLEDTSPRRSFLCCRMS